MSDVKRKWRASFLSTVITGFALTSSLTAANAQYGTPAGKISDRPAALELDWPMPPGVDPKYDAIDGKRMKGYVEELVAISHKSRERGDKFWGRFAGLPSGEETQNWVISKFKELGIQTRVETYDLSTQNMARDWSVAVQGADGSAINLSSATPYIYFDRHMPGTKGAMEVDGVWVGLGTESDFAGKDVRGKAVYVYSVPTPSAMIQSATWTGAVARAHKHGAKALIIILAIPGNLKYASHLQASGLETDAKLPIFTLGLDDGENVEKMMAANGGSVKTSLSWDISEEKNLKGANVIGILPGITDENIVMISHTDGFFEGAADNGAGTAALIETAAFYAAQPASQRRRTMYFIATPDHHSGAGGAKWIHDNMQAVLSKTAIILNAEHVTAMSPVMDREWGAPAAPDLRPSNQIAPSWWGVHGSDALVDIVVDGFKTFGVPTQLHPGGSPGELRAIQFDAPSFYLHNKNIYYHSDADNIDIVPAAGLRTAVQSFAYIFDKINALELSQIRSVVKSENK